MEHYIINRILRVTQWILLTVYAASTNAQILSDSKNLEVTFNKTSTIVFQSSIMSVDRGSRDLMAQKTKGVNNVLQLKAGKINFKETNLTVITDDGALHHFVVRYADNPLSFITQASLMENETDNVPSFPMLFEKEMSDSKLNKMASTILSHPLRKHLPHKSKYDIELSLEGIYIQENIMFYHLKVMNDSYIPYHIDILRFYIKDKQKAKRTSSQEETKEPVYHLGNIELIKGKTSQELIYAIPKFTIPDAKILTIEMMEQKGGRNLQLKINNKKNVAATPVPSA